jgi:hypothetical protein
MVDQLAHLFGAATAHPDALPSVPTNDRMLLPRYYCRTAPIRCLCRAGMLDQDADCNGEIGGEITRRGGHSGRALGQALASPILARNRHQ